VLAAIEDEPASVAQIARALHLARQSVQRIADLLVADDLARYEGNPSHRRAKLLRLTGTGRDALSTIQAAQRVWADEVGRAIGERRLRQASEVLDRALGTLAASGENEGVDAAAGAPRDARRKDAAP
jgi:DNA-binding MarR family transcriptional regulator